MSPELFAAPAYTPAAIPNISRKHKVPMDLADGNSTANSPAALDSTFQCLGDVPIATLYAKHARVLKHFLRRKGIPPEDMEDEFQNLFVHALKGASSFDVAKGTSALTWLCYVLPRTVQSRRQEAAWRRAANLEMSVDTLAPDNDPVYGSEGDAPAPLDGYAEQSDDPCFQAQLSGFEQACFGTFTPEEAALVRALGGLDHLDPTPGERKAAAQACNLSPLTAERVWREAKKKALLLYREHFDC